MARLIALSKNRSGKELVHLATLVSLLAFAALISKVDCVQLDEDGFYDIVIAISEKTAQDGNDDYLQNLKSGIQDFGDALWESTNGKFSIRSADIVLPRHWEYVEEDGYATTQSFQTADIRISHEYLAPQAINPLFCGHPGQYIELPSSIFDVKDTGPHGPTGKALLALWARYRWGIHEEHGFPADPQFPYYWREMRLPDDSAGKREEWKVTNCANAEIKGSYNLTLDGAPCDPDHGDELYPPPSDCRFYPELKGQEATTSLMSFPFIRSLLDFCDAETHDKRAPTRQNHFCKFQSGWEVIQQSPDWLALKEESETERTRIQFRILKKSSRPLLFILTDGVNKPPPEVISGVTTGLHSIFNQTFNWNVIAGVGVFPGMELMDSFDVIYPWSFPWYDGASQIVSSIESAFESRTGYRDFGVAIHQLGTYIKERHSPGAVVLIIKHGSESVDEEQFYTTFEGEVLATILEQKIQIFSLEGKDTQAVNSYRLKYVSELTGGAHFGIEDDPTENAAQVTAAMSTIDQVLKSGVPVSNYKVVHKEIEMVLGSSGSEFKEIRIEQENVKSIKFFVHQLTATYLTPIPPPTFTESPVDSPPLFQDHLNWGKDEVSMKSFVASLDENLVAATHWEYEISSGNFDNCYFLIVAIAELDSSASTAPNDHDISICAFTSADADNSVADLLLETVTSLKGTAFSIYAKLEKNGHPINNPNLKVKAHVQIFLRDFDEIYAFGGFATTIDLVDDGQGAPDMTGNDGIFSGNYIPPIQLLPRDDPEVHCQIFVTARLGQSPTGVTTEMTTESSLFSSSSKSRLITRCGSGWGGCWSETVTEPFMVHADLRRRLVFKGAKQYTQDYLASVSRITDLRVEPKLDGGDANRYNLVWTEPFIQIETTSEDPGKSRADEYQIFYTSNFYHIADPARNDDLAEIQGPHYAGPQGDLKTFEIPGTVEPGTKYYYVIRAWAKDKTSGRTATWSNVAFLHAANPYIVPTTPPTSTVTPPVTDTTTTRATKPSQSTTVPSLTTTTSTTPSTTSSTTRPTTTTTIRSTTTTTVNTTTVRYETTTKASKYWYESTGAIVAFSVFGVLIVCLVGGGLVYYKFFKT